MRAPLRRWPRERVLRLSAAALLPFAAIGLEWLLRPILYPRVLLPLTIGPLLAAWFGGFAAGLWATGLCAVAGWWLFMRPELAAGAPLLGHMISIAAFVGVAVTIAALIERLRRQEQRARDLFEHSSDGVFVADLEGNYTEVNRAGCELLGYSRDELLAMNIRELVPTPDLSRQAATVSLLKSGGTEVAEWALRRKDGTFIDVEMSTKMLPGGRLQAFVRDITSRRRAEKQLQLSAIVFDNTTEAIMVADEREQLISVNRAFTDITGYTAAEAVGRTIQFLRARQRAPGWDDEVRQALQRSGSWKGELWNCRKNGEVYPAWDDISVVRDGSGRVTHYVTLESDITPIKLAEERLDRLAHHDELTGLPNRWSLTEGLGQALERAKRHGHTLAVIFLDLDRFKLINDTMGHAAGDDLLKEVAHRLRRTVRAEDTVARLGGDEFVVLIEEAGRVADIAHVGEKLLAALRQPIVLDGRDVIASGSLGVALYPNDADTAPNLLRAADAAMYRAKERGRHRCEFYTAEMTEKAMDRLTLEQGLRRALARGEFEMYYQPQVDLVTRRITGVEALVRWRDPEHGLILPARFIPVAEESDVMSDLGAWVIRQSLAQARKWIDEGRDAPRIAINVSARQIAHDRLVETLDAARRAMRFEPGQAPVEFEITESVLQSMEHSVTVLTALRSRGARIAIDDFGTGYSSLSLLKELPIDTLKIDHSFVRNIPADPFSNAIASAMITMARTLGLRVIAEGVERDDQAAFLEARGCDAVQGFLYGAAVPGDELGRRLPAVERRP